MSPAGAESAESTVRPFTIAIDEGELVELRDRIARTRWPSPAPGAAWEQGTDAAYLREMLDHWAHRFDWRPRKPNSTASRSSGWISMACRSTSSTSGPPTVPVSR